MDQRPWRQVLLYISFVLPTIQTGISTLLDSSFAGLIVLTPRFPIFPYIPFWHPIPQTPGFPTLFGISFGSPIIRSFQSTTLLDKSFEHLLALTVILA